MSTRRVAPFVAEMDRDADWTASALCFAEVQIALCRVVPDPSASHALLRRDREYFREIPVDEACLARAGEIGCSEHVRTLDAIHLAGAGGLGIPFRYLTFDERQAQAARRLRPRRDVRTPPTRGAS